METEIRGRRDPDFPRRRELLGYRAFVRIQLHKIGHRTPWLPPFVLYVCADDTSTDRTNAKRGRRSSQAARMLTKCRRISLFRTISRLSHTAWEVRVSVAPDFRLHPSSGFGSLIFCQLGQSICQRTDPSKNPSHKPISAKQSGCNSIKFFAQLSFKKARSPFPKKPHKLPPNRKNGQRDSIRFHVRSSIFCCARRCSERRRCRGTWRPWRRRRRRRRGA